MTQKPVTDILLNGELYNSGDDYDRIYSVIEFVNTLTGVTSWTADGYYSIDELPEEVLHSYFVDYLGAQLQQGGLTSFIIASGWNRGTNAYIRNGLEVMGADRHLALFLELEITVNAVEDELEELFIHDYPGSNPVRTAVDILSGQYEKLHDTESLTALNAAYIASLPTKKVLSPRKLWQLAMDALLEKVPDREARRQADHDRLSPEIKAILAVCEEAGQSLVTYHDFGMTDFEGTELMTHEVTTDRGRHRVVFTGTDILLCDERQGKILGRCKADS